MCTSGPDPGDHVRTRAGSRAPPERRALTARTGRLVLRWEEVLVRPRRAGDAIEEQIEEQYAEHVRPVRGRRDQVVGRRVRACRTPAAGGSVPRTSPSQNGTCCQCSVHTRSRSGPFGVVTSLTRPTVNHVSLVLGAGAAYLRLLDALYRPTPPSPGPAARATEGNRPPSTHTTPRPINPLKRRRRRGWPVVLDAGGRQVALRRSAGGCPGLAGPIRPRCGRVRRRCGAACLDGREDSRPSGPSAVVLRSGLSGRSRQCGEGCACVVGPVRCTPPLGDHDRVGEVAGSVGGAAEEHVELGERVSDGSHRE